mmetsp:Transcript_24447/g.52634  ORF Transcript_24447/g.52634 Transcript_24447/m.52634 type:complete len:142 (-) Transcript_24447:143-568(-)
MTALMARSVKRSNTMRATERVAEDPPGSPRRGAGAPTTGEPNKKAWPVPFRGRSSVRAGARREVACADLSEAREVVVARTTLLLPFIIIVLLLFAVAPVVVVVCDRSHNSNNNFPRTNQLLKERQGGTKKKRESARVSSLL